MHPSHDAVPLETLFEGKADLEDQQLPKKVEDSSSDSDSGVEDKETNPQQFGHPSDVGYSGEATAMIPQEERHTDGVVQDTVDGDTGQGDTTTGPTEATPLTVDHQAPVEPHETHF